jgi:hypothetical protein
VLKDDFSIGSPVPLLIPACVRREWQINGTKERAEIEAEFSHSFGYEFEWGQITEELIAQEDCDEADHGSGMRVCWHFVLADLHHEFLDAGSNLMDLSELALTILEQITQHARSNLTPEDRCEILPDYIEFDQGNNISAFEISVLGVDNIDRARQWVDTVFLASMLPHLICKLQAENRLAAEDFMH